MTTVLFNSQKGGTGKTTLSTTTAAFLAARGYRVLLIDFDPQGHVALSFGLDKAPKLYDVMVRGVPIEECVVLLDRESYAPDNANAGPLYILRGNAETQAIPSQVSDMDTLREHIEDLEDEIDVAIIDTAPAAGALLTYAFIAADLVVVPTELEHLSIDGVAGTINACTRFGARLLAIQPNKAHVTAVLHQEYRRILEEGGAKFGWTIWPNIHNRVELAEASAMMRAIWMVNGPMSKARQEVLSFANRVNAVLQLKVPND
ncbi:AAA family ATPase [bacterium]|nr:AAA family ATPase [bacterium]